jgi:hypothetical protein
MTPKAAHVSATINECQDDEDGDEGRSKNHGNISRPTHHRHELHLR